LCHREAELDGTIVIDCQQLTCTRTIRWSTRGQVVCLCLHQISYLPVYLSSPPCHAFTTPPFFNQAWVICCPSSREATTRCHMIICANQF
jgi:hypothetical protein